MLKVLTATAIALILLGVAMPIKVSADTAEQNQHLELECNTDSGAYGQNATTHCFAKGDQSQKLSAVLGARAFYHKPVDTGLDTKTQIAILGVVAAGSVAGYLKLKTRNS